MNKRDFQDNPSKIHGDKLDLKKKKDTELVEKT